MAKKVDIDSPAGYNGHSGPSSADLAMPTKHYPATTNLGNQKGSVELDGPNKGIFNRK